MVSVDNLKVEFGVTPLFEDVSYVINKRDRIAPVSYTHLDVYKRQI